MVSAAVTQDLEPRAIWKHFESLASIPRPSKEEGEVIEWIKKFSEAKGLSWQQDAAGNLVVRRPGSAGGENAPTVVIQGHVDMVCEKVKGALSLSLSLFNSSSLQTDKSFRFFFFFLIEK